VALGRALARTGRGAGEPLGRGARGALGHGRPQTGRDTLDRRGS